MMRSRTSPAGRCETSTETGPRALERLRTIRWTSPSKDAASRTSGGAGILSTDSSSVEVGALVRALAAVHPAEPSSEDPR